MNVFVMKKKTQHNTTSTGIREIRMLHFGWMFTRWFFCCVFGWFACWFFFRAYIDICMQKNVVAIEQQMRKKCMKNDKSRL